MSLIELFYKKPQQNAGSQSVKPLMEKDFQDFSRWAAGIYQELAQETRPFILSDFQKHVDKIDEAYRQEDWSAFQSALIEAKGLFQRAKT
jgi:hypothetical protein